MRIDVDAGAVFLDILAERVVMPAFVAFFMRPGI